MDDEIDIIEMIKSRRYFKEALRKLMSAEKRMKLKEKSRYIMIDPDSDDADSAQEKKRKRFNNVLDLYEEELNQDPGNLTDGFYSSSGAEDEQNQNNQEKEEEIVQGSAAKKIEFG